jgi:hypothetical protein
MTPGVIAITGLCVLLALWYGAGHLVNRRRGQRLFRWLESGLDVLGGEREAGWLGSPASGARVNVIHANPPFRRLEITLLIENREIPVLWLVDRLRGKQDRLIIRATLRSPHRGRIIVHPARGKIRQPEESWIRQEGPHGLSVAVQSPGTEHQVAALMPWLQTYGAHLQCFTWHKTDPHIQLQMKVGGMVAMPSEIFLADLQATIGGATHVNSG